MKTIHLLLLSIITLTTSGQILPQSGHTLLVEPIHQLRIYEIPKANIGVFHDRFKDHASRIMKKHGFHIVSIWETEYEHKTEFVYLLEWENADVMESAWNAFMADQEWKDIKIRTGKEHGNFVDHIQDRILKLTDYSPNSKLLK